jgi:NDP-sugar pyrophosphorylase family protein
MTEIRQAVVLAAGRGKRMGEITADTPKPMLHVQGKPILEHVLDRLATAGVERFLLVVGYRRELVINHFTGWRLPVEFRVQEPVNGTGSATALAREFAGDEPFLLTFGDILCEPSAYRECMKSLNDQTAAVMGVKWVDDPWQGAAVYANEAGVIQRVVEKPTPGTSSTHWNSAGLYALRPLAFHYLDRLAPSPRGEYELTDIFDRMLAEGKELRIASIAGDWRDVGRPEDLAALNATGDGSSK